LLVILIIVILYCLKHIKITKDWEFFLGYLRIFSPKVYEFYHISFREKFHNFRSLSFRSLSCQGFVLSGVCLSGVCLSGVCHGTIACAYKIEVSKNDKVLNRFIEIKIFNLNQLVISQVYFFFNIFTRNIIVLDKMFKIIVCSGF